MGYDLISGTLFRANCIDNANKKTALFPVKHYYKRHINEDKKKRRGFRAVMRFFSF